MNPSFEDYSSSLESLKRELIVEFEESQNQRSKKQKSDDRNEKLIRRISKLISKFENLQNVNIADRKDWRNVVFNDILRFKKKTEVFTKMSTKRKLRTLSLLKTVMSLLITNRFANKRDIFYSNVSIFVNQRNLDEIVEDVCCMLYSSRLDLHIRSTCKGLVYGRVTITIGDQTIDCMSTTHGVTIPHDISQLQSIRSEATFILLVEKDATFQHLINSGFINELKALMITGKGFPDSNTRQTVKLMGDYLRIPIFGLFDADPFGFEIMCIYRFGSLSHAHTADSCVCPQIRWLGLHPTAINTLPLYATAELKKVDEKKVDDLLERPYVKCNKALQTELMMFKIRNRKAEIQSLSETDINLLTTKFIPNQIWNKNWI